MAKLNWTTGIIFVAALLAFIGLWNAGGIAPWIISVGVVVGALGAFDIYHIGTYNKQNHSLTIVLTILTVLFVLVPQIQLSGLAAYAGSAKTPSLSANTLTNNNIVPNTVSDQATAGTPVYGQINFRPTERQGAAFSGTQATVYLLDPSVAATRYDFMKILADSNTGLLLAPGKEALAGSKTVASNAFTWNGQNMKIGQEFIIAGYQDITPASNENVSFVKKAKVVGATGGSTPEIVWQFEDSGSNEYTWRNYAYTGWNDSSDTGRTNYTETQTSAIEKHVKAYVHPLNIGEGIYDGYLWIEAPAANAGAIEDITITEPDGTPHIYSTLTAVSNIAPGSALGMSQPTLQVGTNTMYAVGSFGKDWVRTGSIGSAKAEYTIDVRYNHPASGNVNMYLADTFNTNALTSSGGHIHGQVLNINMTANAVPGTGWT